MPGAIGVPSLQVFVIHCGCEKGEEMAPLELPTELRQAIEQGELTAQQLRQLIAFEAKALGLSYEEAVQRARRGELPRDLVGTDLLLLVTMLPKEDEGNANHREIAR